LETLRDAETPIFATEVSQRYLAREGLEAAAEGLGPRLSSRFSGLRLDRRKALLRISAAGVEFPSNLAGIGTDDASKVSGPR